MAMKKKSLHFGNAEDFRKYNAYRFIHGVNKGGHEDVYIGGHKHDVQHTKKKGYMHLP